MQEHNGVKYAPGSQLDKAIRACGAPVARERKCSKRLAGLLAQLEETKTAIQGFDPWGDPGQLAQLMTRRAALEVLCTAPYARAELQQAQGEASSALSGAGVVVAHILDTCDVIRLAIIRGKGAPTNTAIPGHILEEKERLLGLSGVPYDEYVQG